MSRPRLHDLEPELQTFRRDVLAGLASEPKFLPSQYLYDARGAELFEAICEVPEYYLTRTEAQVLERQIPSIAARVGPGIVLVEPGSGDGRKSRLLLEGLDRPAHYVPIDIAREQLVDLAHTLHDAFPDLHVHPVCADFMVSEDVEAIQMPDGPRLAFMPGSTLGNFEPDVAVDVLLHLRALAGPGGALLVGVDLDKDPAILEPAYDDAAGVSREFALNYLVRMNRELGTDFDLDAFDYVAPYNAREGRIEMAIVSLKRQSVHIGEQEIEFAAGERIRTEVSYKFTLERLEGLARRAGLHVDQVWTDEREYFSLCYLVEARAELRP